MKTFQYVIQDEVGIHARPAGMLVKKAGEFQSNITIRKGEKSADARHLFAIMGLDVKHGETITVEAEGSDEDAAAEAMEKFLKENL